MERSRTAASLSLLLVAALILGTGAGAHANQLTNPGFEDGGGSFDGWTNYASSDISTPDNDDIYRSGTAAAKIYGDFTGCPGNPQFDDGVVFQQFAGTPGTLYEFTGYTFISETDSIPGTNTCDYNRLLAKIVFLNGSGFEIGGLETVIGDYRTPKGEWVEFSVVAPAPTGTATIQPMLIFLQPACDEGAVFVDDLYCDAKAPEPFEPNVLANPSFDNDLSGWTAFGNAYHDGRSWARRTAPGAAKLYGTFVEGLDSGMFQQFPATPGSIWKLDAYAMTNCIETPIQPGNTNVVVANLTFKDAAGGVVGTAEQVIMDDTVSPGGWMKHTLFGTAPAGTDSVAAYLLFVQNPELDQGSAFIDDVSLYDVGTVGVPDEQLTGPTLHQNVPNPFNPLTRIAFELPTRGGVELTIYNVSGREVATLYRGELPAGPHSLTWNGRTNDGGMAASGVYWYQLRTQDGQTARSMILLK